MNVLRLCVVVFMLIVSAPLSAQNGREQVKSKEALAAIKKYEDEYAKINKSYKSWNVDLLKELIAELNPARANAISTGNLNEAQAILSVVKEAESLMELDQVVELRNKNAGTRFEIVSAYWGTQESWIDVTKEVRGMVKINRLVMDAPEKAGFRDPKFGNVKNLLIVYVVDGSPRSAIYNYNQRVMLPR